MKRLYSWLVKRRVAKVKQHMRREATCPPHLWRPMEENDEMLECEECWVEVPYYARPNLKKAPSRGSMH